MSATQKTPIVFGISPHMTYPLTSKQGIVKAERGPTIESSPYFTALSAVTVAAALRIADEMSKRVVFCVRGCRGIKNITGRMSIAHMIRPPNARAYSSIIFFL